MTLAQRWMFAVLERDDYTCQFPGCGANTCLDAAHIVPRSQAPAKKYDPANGITLCRSHHEYFHNHPAQWRRFALTRSILAGLALEPVAFHNQNRGNEP